MFSIGTHLSIMKKITVKLYQMTRNLLNYIPASRMKSYEIVDDPILIFIDRPQNEN